MPKSQRIARRQFFSDAVGTGVVLRGAAAPGKAAPTGPAQLASVSLDEWEASVQSVLATKQLGRAAFLRLTMYGSFAEAEVPAWLGRLVQLAARWLIQPLEQVVAVGTAASGQVSLTLRFHSGVTALASLARGQSQGNGLDLLLLGDHGAVYHDATAGCVEDESLALGKAAVNPKLLAVLQRALRSGRPEAVQRDEQP